MLEDLPWLGFPYDRAMLNSFASRHEVEGLPTLLIMNRDDTIAGEEQGRKGRGDVSLRAESMGVMDVFEKWRSMITIIKV